MKKDKTLLIMAAGMGSRFGGLKQIEPIGPNGEFIIDYSIYDALRTGFNKVVFIIKEENYRIFKETIGRRVEDKIKVEYAFQKLDNLPDGYRVPDNRVKPWGTSHAILSAKDYIKEPFAIINADDFYGYDAFRVVSNFLDEAVDENLEYAMVGYLVKNTLTENGSVKRGVCEVKDGKLEKIIESKVEKQNGVIVATPLNGDDSFEIEDHRYVSMNMFGFLPTIFTYIEDKFSEFLDENKDNIETCEYLIPDTLCDMMENKGLKISVLPTVAVWQGVTYKEDKETVVKEIARLVREKSYPQELWITQTND